MAKGLPGCVGAGSQVLGDLQLPLGLHHLEHERQSGDETHHGHEPGRAAVGGDKGFDVGQAVDARSVFQIGGGRILVAIAKAHQRLVVQGSL